jgi:hypothetical protein
MKGFLFAFFFALGRSALPHSHGNLYPQPAPAQQWSYNRLTFHENWADYATDIDLNNTKVAGYKFYVNSAFPNAFANGGDWLGIKTATAVASSDITGSANVMSLLITANWQGLWTCAWNGSITNANFIEIDGFEALFGSQDSEGSMNIHYWNTTTGMDDSADVYSLNLRQAAFGPSWDTTKMHNYGLLWVAQSLNSGTGLISRYLDGVFMASQTYSSGGTANPAMTPSNPTGGLSEMDSENFCLSISSGQNWPIDVGTIAIWQP